MPDNLLDKGDETNLVVGHLFDFCHIDEDIPMIILKTCPNKFTATLRLYPVRVHAITEAVSECNINTNCNNFQCFIMHLNEYADKRVTLRNVKRS